MTLGVDEDFISWSWITINCKEKRWKLEYIKIKNFYSLKDVIKRMKNYGIEDICTKYFPKTWIQYT